MGLDWTKTIKRALKDENVPMSSIHDLFKNLKDDPKPFRILIKGIPFLYIILEFFYLNAR